MILTLAGLSLDPCTRRLSCDRGSLELEAHVARVLAQLMQSADQVVGRDVLLMALAGEPGVAPTSGPKAALPLDDLLRRTLKDIRAVLRLMVGKRVALTDREAERFVLGIRPKVGTPAALRRFKPAREPDMNLSIRGTR